MVSIDTGESMSFISYQGRRRGKDQRERTYRLKQATETYSPQLHSPPAEYRDLLYNPMAHNPDLEAVWDFYEVSNRLAVEGEDVY
jgi:hypothetical protein